MKCRVCGTELEDGIKKCSVCGTVVDADGSLNEAMSSISSLAKALRSDREKMSQKLKPEEPKKDTNIEDLYVKNVDYTPEIIETDDNFDINAFYEETKDIDDDATVNIDSQQSQVNADNNLQEDNDITNEKSDNLDDNNVVEEAADNNEVVSNNEVNYAASGDLTEPKGFTINFDNGETTETYNYDAVDDYKGYVSNDNNSTDSNGDKDFVTDGYLKETDFQDDNSNTETVTEEPNDVAEVENVVIEDKDLDADNSKVEVNESTTAETIATEPVVVDTIDNSNETIAESSPQSTTPIAKIEPVKVTASEANQPFNFVVPGSTDNADNNNAVTQTEDDGSIKAEDVPYTQLPEVKSSVSDTNPIVINPKDVVGRIDKTSSEPKSDNKEKEKKSKVWGVLSLVMMIIAGLGCIVLFGYILFLQNMTDANAVFQFIIDLFANTSTLAYFAIGVLAAEIIAVIFAVIQIIVGSGKFAQLVLIFNALILIAMCVGMYLTKTFSLILNTLGIA